MIPPGHTPPATLPDICNLSEAGQTGQWPNRPAVKRPTASRGTPAAGISPLPAGLPVRRGGRTRRPPLPSSFELHPLAQLLILMLADFLATFLDDAAHTCSFGMAAGDILASAGVESSVRR